MDSTTNARILSSGAVASAILASICCFGPLALAILGLGGGALLLKLAPFRPYALTVATLFLGAAFYGAYRRDSDGCPPGSGCAVSSRRKTQRIAVWLVAVVVAVAAAFPYLSRWLFE